LSKDLRTLIVVKFQRDNRQGHPILQTDAEKLRVLDQPLQSLIAHNAPKLHPCLVNRPGGPGTLILRSDAQVIAAALSLSQSPARAFVHTSLAIWALDRACSETQACTELHLPLENRRFCKKGGFLFPWITMPAL
jgi:hypothetical protein